MIQKLSVPVSVSLVFNHKTRQVYPKSVLWEGKLHPIAEVGLHHTFYKGKTLYHVFSVSTQSTFFRLVLDTQTLHWQLEEISDGLPN